MQIGIGLLCLQKKYSIRLIEIRSVVIISHKNNFIFIKPRKVAGTTIEIKLSQYLCSGDLATPIEPEEEHLRSTSPGVVVAKIRGKSLLGIPRKLRDHSTLQRAYSILNPKIRDYFIISACRNPWDRAVSQFFWSYRKRNIAAEDFKTQKFEFNKFVKIYGPIGPKVSKPFPLSQVRPLFF